MKSSRLFAAFTAVLLPLPAFWMGCGDDSAQPDSEADASTAVSDAGGSLSDSGTPAPDAGGRTDASGEPPDAGGEADAGDSCPRLPKEADRARKVVVAHPFDDSRGYVPIFDVLDLSTEGVLTQPEPRVSFSMGIAVFGEIAFTPDGELGFVAQKDGSVGAFRIDESGAPEVLYAAYKDGFYADRVVMDPSGERFYVVDGNWPAAGGGIHSIRIGCDGALTNEGRVLSAKSPSALSFIPSRPGKVLLVGKEVQWAAPLANAHLVDWGAEPSLVGSAAAFPDDKALVSDARVMPDGKWALVSDNNSQEATGVRVAAVELQSHGVRAVQVLMPFTDPGHVVPSPWGNAAMVVAVEGDALHLLAFDPTSAAAPFRIVGEVQYLNQVKPQLPDATVVLDRGALKGLALVSEVEGIRRLRFEPAGTITDLGVTQILEGMEAITGALGVQP